VTFADLEESRYQGKPVECFRFVSGGLSWYYTSADRQVVIPMGTFEPETISRTEQDFSQEDVAATIEVRVPRINPVAALFIGELPSNQVVVQIIRAHRELLTDANFIFTGEVSRARFEGSEATLICTGLLKKLERQVPTIMVQGPCNHVLYSTGCGVSPSTSRDSVLITTVTGATVVSNDFAVRADGWFDAGRLVSPAGETRMIVSHVGNTVTLMSPMPGLASLDQCWAYWGCDHLEESCSFKFANLDNFLGWSRLPGVNPFVKRID
jgi:uncharacterized phage protein (TIGR02218 family)